MMKSLFESSVSIFLHHTFHYATTFFFERRRKLGTRASIASKISYGTSTSQMSPTKPIERALRLATPSHDNEIEGFIHAINSAHFRPVWGQYELRQFIETCFSRFPTCPPLPIAPGPPTIYEQSVTAAVAFFIKLCTSLFAQCYCNSPPRESSNSMIWASIQVGLRRKSGKCSLGSCRWLYMTSPGLWRSGGSSSSARSSIDMRATGRTESKR